MKGKMAVIGDGDSILVFKAVGLDTYRAENTEEAKRLLRQHEKDYRIFFLSERFAEEMEEMIAGYNDSAYPIVVSLASGKESTGYGARILRGASERALGLDILSQEGKKNEGKNHE